MIEPNELRIGNWFLSSSNKPEQLESIYDIYVNPDISMHFQEIEGETFEGINPIRLTPEILENCGFNRMENQFITNYYVLNNFMLEVDDLICRWIGDNTIVNVWHLHQLQNLYFALTGKELEVDLS